MHLITYVSTARQLFSTDALRALLIKSRDNNLRLDVTGMLLYRGGNFIQAIEGPKESISLLYAKIRSDASHYNVMTLLDEPIQARAFPNWRMGFLQSGRLDDPDIDGFTNFLLDHQAQQQFSASASEAMNILSSFGQKVR